TASPDKHKDIVSKQKDDGSIELDDTICKELIATKEEIIDTIKEKITHPKLQLPDLSSSLATAVNLSYLENAASKYKGDWVDKYNKARDYLSKQIGDADAEKELLDCADEFVVEKTTYKVIDEKKRDVIDLKKDEIPKEEKSKAKVKSFIGTLYDALIVVEEAASPEKCKEIVADQKDDGCIELKDTVCDELDAPKEEIIKTIQKNITNPKLKLPESSLATAINLSYLKKAAPKHEGVWKDKADKARKYLSDQIGDKDAEKELEECADNYVVDNCVKKVIKNKKRNAVVTVQESATPEKCDDIVSDQKDDGSIEVSETICKEIDVLVTDVVPEVKECTENPKLKSPESEPWWKTGLATSYLNIAAPHHKNQWEDKSKKANEFLSKQIGDADAEKELKDCTDKYVVDNIAKKVEKDHKRTAAIVVIQERASPDKHKEIVSNQKEDGSIKLDNSVCKELDTPKEEIIKTVRKNLTNKKLQSPEFSSSLETAINLSYLKNAAPKYKGDWVDKYNKAREYLSKQIGDADAEKELLECADKYVVDKAADKVIKEHKKDVIDLKKGEKPKDTSFFSSIYESAAKLGENIEKALGYDRSKPKDYEKAEAITIVQDSASPEKCKEIVADQKEDGSIELSDTVCDELDAPKEEVIKTIKKNITNKKLQSPEFSSSLATAVNLSYLKKAASKHEGEWKDKYNKAREYLSKQIGDKDAEKELEECADNYVVDNCIKKVIKNKRRNSVRKAQESATPEKCDDIVSSQKDDGSIEVSETICKELDVPVTVVVSEVKKCTQNPKLRSPESESWWKTALAVSYFDVAAPKHKKPLEDKYNKAREYLSKQIGDEDAAKELLDCTDQYIVDNITKKVEKDLKKEAAIAIVQESASPDKHKEIVSQQKDDGSIEIDDSICKELHAPKDEIIDTIKEKVTNPKLKLPEHKSSLATAINLSYLKNAAPKYKDDWEDKYNKAREYLSKQIGDKDAEKELEECADEYVIDKTTVKVIEEKKQEIIDQNKDEIPKVEEPKAKAKSFIAAIYDGAVKLEDQIEKTLGFNQDKDKLDDHEKAEALIVIEEAASPEKCKEIVADQKDDGCIELKDTVCDELDAPKEEIVKTIQPKLQHKKLQQLPNLPSILETAINLSYLKKAAPKHEGVWKDKADKAHEYISDQIKDKDAEKELEECADNYVVDNCVKKVIKDKKRNAVVTVQESATPEKCDDIVSNQKDDGSFEVSETICKEIDIPATKVVNDVKKCSQNPKLRSPESEPWWKTGLATSYLNIAAPHHKKQWEDKSKKAQEYLAKEIKNPDAEKELIDCTDKYVVDNLTKKVEKDHKKDAAIAVVKETASPDKHKDIVSKQKDDGSIELDDTICKELLAPKEEIIDTIKEKVTNPKLKLPEHKSSLATAVNLSYLKNAASKYKGDWVDKYNKARDYLSKQIGDADAEKELIDCADEFVVEKTTYKVIDEKKRDVIDLMKDEIPKVEEPKAKAKSFIALIVVEEAASPEKCKEVVADQKDDGCIELKDTVCDELDAPKEEIIKTIQPKLQHKKLQQLPNLPSILETAINLSYLKKAAPKHEGVWKDKADKARKYLSDQIADKDAEKELEDCADNYVVDNCVKKVIKDKKRNAVETVQESTTPEKCDDIVSNQKDDGSFEVSETICKEIDVPVTKVVNDVKKCSQNPKLRSPESEPWWKTGLATSYLNIAAPHHKKQWEDKSKKAQEYLAKEIKNPDAEKELIDCTDKYVVDNLTKKVEKDHKKDAAIAVVKETASPDKHEEIVSKQKDDGSIELDDSICKELHAHKEEIIDTVKEKVTNPKLKLPEHKSSLATAVNLSYLKNAASKYKGDWVDKYNKARDYLSKQIGDADAEKELLDCADEFVVEKTTYKVIDEKKRDVIDLKKDEIPKVEEPKAKVKSFIAAIYDDAVKLEDQIEKTLGFNQDKDKLDDHEKAEALIVVEEAASPEKCKEIVADQKDDGCIELKDTVCNELDAPKEEIIKTIQPKLKNQKLQLPNLPSILETAINLSYLKKAAPKHKDKWEDKADKARKYLSDQIGDKDAEKELEECADNYVVDNCIKKVIKDKKRNAVVTVQESTTPEKCNEIVSDQKDDGSFEVSETICKEIDIPAIKVVNDVKKCSQNPKLRSPESEPWWKTGLATSYLNIAAPNHKNQWEDKHDKARKYLSEQINDAELEKEILDCTDKYVVDNITKKVEKDHKKDAAIAVVKETASPDKHKDIVSKQKDDGSIELDDEICKELHAPKDEIIDTVKEKVTNPKLKLPEHKSSLATAVNLSYLKNAASKYKGDWVDKYNKARDYLSNKIGDAAAEKELLDCADEFVVEKTTYKVIDEKKRDVIDLKKDEIPKEEPKAKAKSFFGIIYDNAVKLEDQVEKALGFDKDKLDDHEKAEALIIVEEAASPEKCKEIVADQKDDGCIELKDTVCDELDAPKEEIIKTIQPRIQDKKLQQLPNLPSILETAINLSYLKKAAPKHEGVWKGKADKAREYLSDQIKDKHAEKELEECADNYVVDNCVKKVIKDKKRNAVVTVQESITPEKCDDIVSNQKEDGSIEVIETICKEIDVPATKVVTEVKKGTQNKKLRSPESEPWWKTALSLSYLNIAAPQHKKQWEDKHDKARKYLSEQIGDDDAAKELLDCTDKYVVDNIAKKVEKDHKKDVAIVVVQESASPDKHKDIVSKQKDDGSIELDDEICKELHAPKDEIIDTVKEKVTNPKLKLPEHKSSLATAVNLSYLKNAASKYKGDWVDKYNKARDYLSKQIGDVDAEKELLDCADEFVVEKTTVKVIDEKKRDVIDLKKDEIPKEEKPKAKAKSFIGTIYDNAVKLEDQIEKALGFDKDKKPDDHEKAEALIVVEEAASPEKCKEIVADQKDDGCIELNDTVCDELDAPKEEIVKTIQQKLQNKKLQQLPNRSSILGTAINLSYLKKAAPKHKGVWNDKAEKAREYLSDQIKDKDAEKELEECADNYVVDNCVKKVIKDKKRNAVVTVQESTTPEKCDDIVSKQKDDGSFEVIETICKEIDVPATDVVNEVKECTENPKLKSPESEPWWKTGLATSYLNIAAPHHKNKWEDKSKKAQEYLAKEIKNPDTEKELIDCTDKYVIDNIAKKVEKDHKKDAAITVIQDSASPDKHKDIVTKQKDDGSIQLDDTVCNDLGVPKENIIDTIKNNITHPKLQLPQLPSILETALNLSYLKNAAPKHKGDWVDKYNKARDYISKQIGDADAEKELLDCTDNYVVDKATDKAIEDHKKDVVDVVTEQISKHDALATAQESASPDKCKEIVSNQKDDGSIELGDTVCDELAVPKEEIIPTIQEKVTHEKLKSSPPSLFSTAIVLSYLKKLAPKHKDHWKDQYDKACDYISKTAVDHHGDDPGDLSFSLVTSF
ncbi:21465_t:CDS:2, partial [Racocetra persica]